MLQPRPSTAGNILRGKEKNQCSDCVCSVFQLGILFFFSGLSMLNTNTLTCVDKCSLFVLCYRQDLFSYSEPTTPTTQSSETQPYTSKQSKQNVLGSQYTHHDIHLPKLGQLFPGEIARTLPRIQLALMKMYIYSVWLFGAAATKISYRRVKVCVLLRQTH